MPNAYLYRWKLLSLRGEFGVYLHHFVGDDWSRDLHDHPKRKDNEIANKMKACS